MNTIENLVAGIHRNLRWRVTGIVVSIILLTLYFAFCLIKGGTDFYTYFIAAKAFQAGFPAYLMDLNDFKAVAASLHIKYYASPYYYPPLTAQFLLAFLFLPPQWAYFFWLILSSAALIWSVYLLTGKEYFLEKLFVVFAFTCTSATFYSGQINAFLLLSLCLAYYGLKQQQNCAVGIGLASGIMFKILPVAHWCYLVWQGRFKAALWGLGFLLVLFLVSLPLVKMQGWIDFYHLMLAYSQPKQLMDLPTNQALSGLIARLVYDPEQAIKVWQFSRAILIVATALICLPLKKKPAIFDWEFSLVTVAINLFMPYSWYHQNILLLIPIFLLWKNQFPSRNFLVSFLLLFYLFYNLHGFFWHYLSRNPVGASIPVVLAIFLWLVLAVNITLEKYRENFIKIIYLILAVAVFSLCCFCFVWHKGIDFECYYRAAKSFYVHARPYLNLYPKQGFLYYYPPLTAAIILPLTLFKLPVAYFIWSLCSVAATALGVYILIEDKRYYPQYLLLAFVFFPVPVTFYAGQVNCLLFLVLCIAHRGLIQNKMWKIGWGIALGIMLKWIPLAHFFYLIWRRNYKAALIVILSLGSIIILTLPFAGWQDWRDFFHLLSQFGTPALPHQGLVESLAFNQALSGLTMRFFKSYSQPLYLAYGLDVLFIIGTAVLCWPKGSSNEILGFEFALVTITVNLIMPYTWYYQYVVLIIPLFILLQNLHKDGHYKNKTELLLIFTGYILTDFHALSWRFLQNPLLTSFPTFFAVLLWILLAKRLYAIKLMQYQLGQQQQLSA